MPYKIMKINCVNNIFILVFNIIICTITNKLLIATILHCWLHLIIFINISHSLFNNITINFLLSFPHIQTKKYVDQIIFQKSNALCKRFFMVINLLFFFSSFELNRINTTKSQFSRRWLFCFHFPCRARCSIIIWYTFLFCKRHYLLLHSHHPKIFNQRRDDENII